MKTTIKDIARLAGVSVSTVSRALNDTGPVDEETRERILALSTRLDYRPSALAQGLVTQRTKTIMLLVPDVANYFFAEIVQEMSSMCREHEYRVLLGNTVNRPDVEREYLNMMKDRAVDGAILIPMSCAENLDVFMHLARANFPMVLVDRTLERLKMSYVLVDNVRGADMVVDYLYGKGHRKMAFIGGDINEVKATGGRFRGFMKGLESRNCPVRTDYVFLNRPSPDRGAVDAVDQMLRLPDPPSAVFADNDLTAIACIAALRRKGCRVPDDVAVVGFDNINISAFVDVPLTTVSQPKRKIAELAVELVLEHIDFTHEGKEYPIRECMLMPELVVRESA